MGGGGGGGGPNIVPFNMSELLPFMPSVSNGPFNAAGAATNATNIRAKYPWIMPAAGAFTGALPGQFAGSGPSSIPGQNPGTFGPGFGGVPGQSSNMGSMDPQTLALIQALNNPTVGGASGPPPGNINIPQPTVMQPNSLNQILSTFVPGGIPKPSGGGSG